MYAIQRINKGKPMDILITGNVEGYEPDTLIVTVENCMDTKECFKKASTAFFNHHSQFTDKEIYVSKAELLNDKISQKITVS